MLWAFCCEAGLFILELLDECRLPSVDLDEIVDLF